ncbi:hypothetical protein [Bradyrhizobium sp.]
MIDSKQATEALTDIDEIVRRVRQSRIYNFSSLMLIMWGALVFAGYVTSYIWPRTNGLHWLVLDAIGLAGSLAIGASTRRRAGVNTFSTRFLAAFVLFIVFGCILSIGVGHLRPRQMDAFWPIYFMMVYTIAGLWFGYAFVAIGVGITALTLIGYFFAGDWFNLWMAVVDGGGLMLGGLWMRRS